MLARRAVPRAAPAYYNIKYGDKMYKWKPIAAKVQRYFWVMQLKTTSE